MIKLVNFNLVFLMLDASSNIIKLTIYLNFKKCNLDFRQKHYDALMHMDHLFSNHQNLVQMATYILS